jgi:hypothetical protein
VLLVDYLGGSGILGGMEEDQALEGFAALLLITKQQERQIDYLLQVICGLIYPANPEMPYEDLGAKMRAYGQSGEDVASIREVLETVERLKKEQT